MRQSTVIAMMIFLLIPVVRSPVQGNEQEKLNLRESESMAKNGHRMIKKLSYLEWSIPRWEDTVELDAFPGWVGGRMVEVGYGYQKGFLGFIVSCAVIENPIWYGFNEKFPEFEPVGKPAIFLEIDPITEQISHYSGYGPFTEQPTRIDLKEQEKTNWAFLPVYVYIIPFAKWKTITAADHRVVSESVFRRRRTNYIEYKYIPGEKEVDVMTQYVSVFFGGGAMPGVPYFRSGLRASWAPFVKNNDYVNTSYTSFNLEIGLYIRKVKYNRGNIPTIGYKYFPRDHTDSFLYLSFSIGQGYIGTEGLRLIPF